jgi:PAS domain S-box-containing protein
MDLICKDGRRVPTEYRASAIKDKAGDYRYVIAIGRDITERKRVEEALLKNEEQYRLLVDQAVDGFFQLDAQGNFIFVNEAICKMLGYSREELLSRSIFDTYRETEKEIGRERFAMIPSGTSIFFERDMLRKDGSTFSISASTVKLADSRMQAIVRDITEQKRVEQELRTSETQLSNALSMACAGHWEYDVAGDTFTFNDNFYRIFRTTAEAVGGYRMSSADYAHRFCHPDDRHMVGKEVRAAIETDDPYYSRQVGHRILYANGEVGYIVVRFFIIKDSQGRTVKTYGVNQDITEHKQDEEKLRKSKKRYRLIADNSNDWIYLIRPDLTFEYVSPSCEKIIGYTFREFIDNPRLMLDIVHPEDKDLFASHIKNIGQEFGSHNMEFRIYTKNGELRWIRHSCQPVYDEEGQYHGRAGTNRDITPHKRAEKALKESEERYRTIFEQSNDGIALVQGDRHLYVNQKMVKMFGYDHPEEIIGRTHTLLVHPDDVEWVEDYNRRRQKEETVPDRYEFKGRKKNGEELYVEVSAVKTVYQGGPVSLAFLRDVTERKQAEMQIQSSLQEKEILLKEIHHRVKNNLAVIASILSLQSANAPDKTYQDIFQECVNRVKTMSRIHTQIYQAKDLAHIDFKSYLQELIPELFRSYQVHSHDVSFNLQIEDFTPDINTAIPLGLIVNELLTNSLKHAFPEGRKGEIRISLKKDDSQTVLTVADNGIGFPEDLDLTRAQSLGLQLVTALVYQLRGTVEIKREKGTEFVITFPAEK